MKNIEKKIFKLKNFTSIKKILGKKKISLCHGVFDILHYGHLKHLQQAKEKSDILIVSITEDKFVNKGPGRPYNKSFKRLFHLACLDFVDFVCLSSEPTSQSVINTIQPNFYFKGKDYKELTENNLALQLEKNLVEKYNGKIVFTETALMSSSNIINKFFNNLNDEQKNILNKIKNKYEINEIIKIISNFKKIKVVILGEPIIDEYIITEPKALGSKSSIISSLLISKNSYSGGSLAVANSISEFTYVGVFIPRNKEDYRLINFLKSLNKKIIKHIFQVRNWYAPIKKRYLNKFQFQKIFEVNEISESLWKHNKILFFIEKLKSIFKKYDLVVITDFGHGLFESDKFLKFINKSRNYKSINVQSNSMNLGYNFFDKYRNYNYLSIDEREFRLCLRDEKTDLNILLKKAIKMNIIQSPFSITLGSKGSIFVNSKNKIIYCPVFFDKTTDTVGAGDSYLALTSLLVKSGLDDELIPFLGNIYAGLQSQFLANSNQVSKDQLISVVKSILS